MSAANTVVAGVNETRFLEHLKTFFSSSTVVLAEAMQNARRAGADSVKFDYDTKRNILTITDDGHGIKDFRTLLTVAESNWSKSVMDSDQPFGIGFFSVAFAAEKIRVSSNSREINFSSEDLIAKSPINIFASVVNTGARINLFGCKLSEKEVDSALRGFAKGFAIPVFWNGEELPRPHAEENLAGAFETKVGLVYVPAICYQGEVPKIEKYSEVPDTLCFTRHTHTYCQGLPVMLMSGMLDHFAEYRAIIHVDSRKYQPRMPDRACLVDSEKARKDFTAEICDIWREYLLVQKTTLSAEEFVDQHWKNAKRAGCLEIMGDVPCLPKYQAMFVDEYPVIQECDGSNFSRHEKEITKAEVEGGLMLFRDFDQEWGDAFVRLTWAKNAKALFLKEKHLPSNHWALPYLRDLASEKMEVGGKVVAEGRYNGNWVGGKVQLLEGLTVTILGITAALHEAVVTNVEVDEKTLFLVPTGINCVGDVVRQASSYNYNDCYQETDCEIDRRAFDNFVAVLAGEPAEETLTKCLSEAKFKPNLLGKEFCVSFDAEGKVTVLAKELP